MIPVYEPMLAGHEEGYLLTALKNLYLSGHSKPVRVFEGRFADYLGVEHAIAVSSGTAALETALHAVGVKKGDEVILPSFTIISCAIAVLRVGATPVLVDVTPDTWCIDPDLVARAITERTRAVMPVHMMGHPAPMGTIALKSGVGLHPDDRGINPMVVEDACEALGAKFDNASCGTYHADASAFSFYPNKLITTGEGGMVTTDDDEIADRARKYRNLYLGSGTNRFHHTDIGYNYRMSGLDAALGLAQLEQIDTFLELKLRNARMYRNRLAQREDIEFQIEQPWAKSAHWMNGIVLKDRRADEVIDELEARGVEARPFFLGLHEQPCLSDVLFHKDHIREIFPVTERLSRHGLYLPSGPGLTDTQIDTVCTTLQEILDG